MNLTTRPVAGSIPTDLNPPKSYYYERATDADICVCCHDEPGEYAVTAGDPKVCYPCLVRIHADNRVVNDAA